MLYTFNQYHLGDNLIHLNYLRKLGVPVTHYCDATHHYQLEPLTRDTQISLAGIGEVASGAINAWIGEDGYFYNHPKQDDWVAFHLDWFTRLSEKLGVPNPIATSKDLLFDYPALLDGTYPEYDYLVINSVPLSGQLPSYHPDWFLPHIEFWVKQGLRVITTLPTGLCPSTVDTGMTVTQIGSLSRYCKNIFGVATGPIWPTFNIYNLESVQTRTIFCQQELALTPNTRSLRAFY